MPLRPVLSLANVPAESLFIARQQFVQRPLETCIPAGSSSEIRQLLGARSGDRLKALLMLHLALGGAAVSLPGRISSSGAPFLLHLRPHLGKEVFRTLVEFRERHTSLIEGDETSFEYGFRDGA